MTKSRTYTRASPPSVATVRKRTRFRKLSIFNRRSERFLTASRRRRNTAIGRTFERKTAQGRGVIVFGASGRGTVVEWSCARKIRTRRTRPRSKNGFYNLATAKRIQVKKKRARHVSDDRNLFCESIIDNLCTNVTRRRRNIAIGRTFERKTAAGWGS